MPLPEFHRAAARGEPKSNHSCSSDLSPFMPDNEFVELLWENGQILTQGQPNRPKRSTTFPTPFPYDNFKVQDKEGRSATAAAIPKIGLFEPINDSSLSVPVPPPAPSGLHPQADDIGPWINYQAAEDPFCSEFFSELSGTNPLSNDRNNGLGARDLHNNEEHGLNNTRPAGQLVQSPQQCPAWIPSSRPRVTDLGAGGAAGGGGSSNPQSQFQKLDFLPASKPPQLAGGVMNFSHFSRPVTRTKANDDRSKRTTDASAVASANPMQSARTDPSGIRASSTTDLANRELASAAKPLQATFSNYHPNNILTYNYNSAPEVNLRNSSFAAGVASGRHETEKGPEPAVVASSVCSGGCAGDGSNDPKHRGKMKNREGNNESGYLSEDLEDDSVGVKRPAMARAGTSTKRSRAAEVHNMSERKRRDRINEKMRALQELIPNCNKVDKASMLDEAIEYLKSLQLQVQMMSMGSGLCMSPMMLPPGMHHFRAPPMAHFSPIGLGMGMGYGMGMFDMNGSPGCPLIPVPPMHTTQFPCTSIAEAAGLHGAAGSTTGLQLFGAPGHRQGLPMLVPRAQLFGPLPGPAAKGNSMNGVSGTMVHPMPGLDADPPSSCKEPQQQQQQQQQQNVNLEATQKASTSRKESLESDLI